MARTNCGSAFLDAHYVEITIKLTIRKYCDIIINSYYATLKEITAMYVKPDTPIPSAVLPDTSIINHSDVTEEFVDIYKYSDKKIKSHHKAAQLFFFYRLYIGLINIKSHLFLS